ncbi:MAG: hypothetical protein JO266_17545 [Acidobacteria bacterium]|nr:hypothetical protein [Acidobacteriota bacterium]MBV8893745.1 hypothetical protein [Acidobacteriota bacterium]MBV9479740.1 hypothetical protein [Acidobacteriota bacterium]
MRFYLPASRLVLPLLVLSTAVCLAKSNPDRTQFGRDIHVAAGEKAADLVCVNCSIYVRGQVAGDATAVRGNIVVESGGEVAGDAVAVWGNIRAESGTKIAGDLTSIAGSIRRDPQSAAAGDVTALEGSKWLLAILVPPILFLGGIVALLIWLIERNRRSRPAPVFVEGQPTTRA